MLPQVRLSELVVGGQDGTWVRAREMDGAEIARGHVAVRVEGGDGEAAERTGGLADRRATDDEVAGGGGGDGNACLQPGNARRRGIRGRERPEARRFQRGARDMHAGIGRGERVIPGQDGLRIAAAEVDFAPVSGDRIARAIFHGDRDGARHTSRDVRWEAADDEVRGCSNRGPILRVEQHRDIGGTAIGDRQVGKRIDVKVTHNDGAGTGPGRVGQLGPECAVAVTEQHAHTGGVGYSKVGFAVLVEVAHGD